MIDFRFHLISLVAVFLALGLGILMGSVVLDQQLVKILQNDISDLRSDKRELQDDVISLEERLEVDTRFAEAAEEWLIARVLEGEEVLLLRFSSTDERVTDGLVDAVENAGGRVTATVTLTERLALPGAVERDQLALAVESVSGRPAEVRTDAADFLGARLASAATSGGREGRIDPADVAAVNLLIELEDAGFVELDGIEEGQRIADAVIALVGGSTDPRPFNLARFATSFAESVVSRGGALMVAESSDSGWGLVESVRGHDIGDQVSTVDHAETIAGRIAMALVLGDAGGGRGDHYGVRGGSSDVIPRPTPQD